MGTNLILRHFQDFVEALQAGQAQKADAAVVRLLKLASNGPSVVHVPPQQPLDACAALLEDHRDDGATVWNISEAFGAVSMALGSAQVVFDAFTHAPFARCAECAGTFARKLPSCELPCCHASVRGCASDTQLPCCMSHAWWHPIQSIWFVLR